jgi:hypothetical protein
MKVAHFVTTTALTLALALSPLGPRANAQETCKRLVPAKTEEINFDRKIGSGRNSITYDVVDVVSLNRLVTTPQYCSAPTREYVPLLWIEIGTEHRDTMDVLNAQTAERFVIQEFPHTVVDVLSRHTDTTAVGWEDSPNTVCRAHQKKPSLVLPAPYFEDVEYCFSLLPFDDNFMVPAPARRKFRIRAEASVTLTKNPGSGYREPTRDEAMPYGESLGKFVRMIRDSLGKAATQNGWLVSTRDDQIGITGVLKK